MRPRSGGQSPPSPDAIANRRTLVVLQHVAHEGPARIAALAAARGLEVRVLRLDAGETVPHDVAAGDLLVVMGGPMGVGDLGDARFPFLAREVDLLHAVLDRRRPVLGICLGAQLLAHVAGARVYPNPELEVGWGPVHIHERGREPVVEGLAEQEIVLHWHGDTFDLPPGAALLASTQRCRNQAFRLGRAFGLQFHIELEGEAIDTWLREDAAFVRRALGDGGADLIRTDTRRWMTRHREMGDRLIENVLAAMLEP